MTSPKLNPQLWHLADQFWVTGYLHSLEGQYYESEQVAVYFANARDEADFTRLLQNAKGCFGCITKINGTIYAAVDCVRSIPLFYQKRDCELLLADNSNHLQNLQPSALEHCPREILAEYLLTGYVTGCDTLIPNLKQIPAGNYLKWTQGSEPVLVQYYRFTHNELKVQHIDDYADSLDRVHLAMVRRLTDSLQGRTAVIPLSGGYDSRLVASLLKRVNYPRILCFSYGEPGNPESAISQAVAKSLNLPWRFIPHSRNSWFRAFQSSQRKEYYRMAINASSAAHIQDWLAVNILHEKGVIPRDAIFIPGHTGDFIEGLHLPRVYDKQTEFSRKDLTDQIFRAHYNLWEWERADYGDLLAQRINSGITIPSMMDATTAASLFEEWEWAERQAKFIVNSLRVYEFFGYGWRIPLWDRELLDFWSNIPLSLRLNRRLWNHYQSRYLKLQVPVFVKPPLCKRIQDKLIGSTIGNLADARYGRFAPYRNILQYSSSTVQSFLQPDISYPSFINPQQRLLRASINGLQALASLQDSLPGE